MRRWRNKIGPGDDKRDGERDRDHQRREREQRERGERTVDRVLDGELPSARVGRAQREQRQATDVVERRALVDRLVEPRDERDLDSEPLALLDLLDEHVVGLGGEREDHLPGPGLLDRSAEVVEATEHGQQRRSLLVTRGSGSESRNPTGRSP